MEDNFEEYLQELGMEQDLIDRVDQILSEYLLIKEFDIEDIFVSEFKNEEGETEYENLWFFTSDKTLEAKNFAFKDDYDIAIIKDSVKYLKFTKNNFDFENATQNSRLNVEAVTTDDVQVHLKASGENCTKLFSLATKYLSPNLIEK